ncbi:MAG: tetratricopeptide repeat protein [Planctomycetes bacterium]|nr:tetratricopeptide repeat protein [Planctomycetota bacterium]
MMRSGFWIGAIIAAVSAARAEDIVTLENGEIRRGRVIDPGRNAIDVITSMGGTVRIPKRDVAQIELGVGEAQEGERTQDRVLTKDGREIAGEVRVSKDGKSIIVKIPGGEVSIPRGDVVRVIGRASKDEEGSIASTAALRERIPRWVEGLGGAEAGDAERRLREAGILAANALEEAQESATGVAGERIRRLLAALELRRTVGDVLDERMPKIYEDLEGDDAAKKVSVLKAAFLAAPEEAVALLGFVLKDPAESPEVRSFATEFLRRLHRNQELVDIYAASSGRAQLALALALGENGIYVGIPTLIEALEMEDVQVRTLAIDHLLAWTGTDFGFVVSEPDDGKRGEAIRRWRTWWESNRVSIERDASLHIHPPADDAPERIRAVELWTEANREWSRGNYDAAEVGLRRAVLADPSFAGAHLALGIFLARVREQPVEAATLLRKVAERRFQSMGADCQILAFYHLGELYGKIGQPAEGRRFLEKALVAKPDYIEARLALGRLYHDEAIRAAGLSAKERLQKIDAALAEYRKGVDSIDAYSKSLSLLRIEDIPVGEQIPFVRREHNQSLLSLRKYLRGEKAAALCAMARAALAKRDEESARVLATEAIRETEGYIPARLILAHLLARGGNAEGAAREYREILRRDPENPEAKEGLARAGG